MQKKQEKSCKNGKYYNFPSKYKRTEPGSAWKTWSGSLFCVLFQEEKIFSSHWLLALISCYPRISLTSAIASPTVNATASPS